MHPLGLHEFSCRDESKFLSILKQRLKDNFIQNWNERLEASSRALFYRVIANFSFQPYLEIVTIAKFRVALSRLRTSSHRLKIETGRWKNPNQVPIIDRKCQICNKLEDGHHFLTECVLYNDSRKLLIKPYFIKNSSMFKTIELVKSENTQILRKLAVYTFKAFEQHKLISQ